MQIRARNVNDAIIEALWLMRASATQRDSRNGPVMVMPEPFMTTYLNPTERVLFWPKRDANPFFHLMEAIWMMAGRNDAAYVGQFSKFIGQFAEDDGRFHGAYGLRWNGMFGCNQLAIIAAALKADKTDRRQVLQMWSPHIDLGAKKRDLPCNTQIYFDASGGALDMTVCNRSNDMFWGAYGANVVHFSFMQEAMAAAIGIPVGRYHQFSNNFHAYVMRDDYTRLTELIPTDAYGFNYYAGRTEPLVFPLGPISTIQNFQAECGYFCERKYSLVTNAFLEKVAKPMQEFYLARKQGINSKSLLTEMPLCDWKIASLEWVERR